MSRLSIDSPSRGQTVVEGLYRDVERRISASPPGLCPVDMALSFLRLCHAQTCGKCVPCRIGLGQLTSLLESVLDSTAKPETIDLIEKTARVIQDTADCAIGYEAARMVLQGVQGFRDDYLAHVEYGRCLCGLNQPVPCVALCPAGVDIPGYISLVRAGRCDDAVRLIRKDNPFPTVCGYVCEHPCEARCRRRMMDDAVNICGIKRYACDHASPDAAPPPSAPPTGKRVAVVGGGPGGLSAAYFLSLMGHAVEVYDQRPKLGGMLRYGIPDYRLPQEKLDADIAFILSTGIKVHTDISIGRDISFSEIEEQYDAVYLAIGAHNDKKLGIPGEDSEGVYSAVQMLRDIGEGRAPDLQGKRVCVIGGGNVSMDATRTAIRLGAASVTCVYRRRMNDMTALAEEIEEAAGEGAQLLYLQAPDHVEADENGQVTALWTRPQIIGEYGSDGRPKPHDADARTFRIPCDVVIVAIGQAIDAKPFEQIAPVVRGKIQAASDSFVPNTPHVFAGGDAVTGPATVIRAVAAGKVAAANIDAHLGFHHIITTDVDIPPAHLTNTPACGRVELRNRPLAECKDNFELVKCGMTDEEALQETSRCLRCDHFGFGIFKGGRTSKW
ncbi:NAD(P)-binding protein [Agathobaculum sp.]|uniref:NAD(P)-binding protein n=1 Tax=Agathobaculum sp. TaxID=2048138 RepID=UPI002A80B28B|nr:NAD(P)-binding protein [Agathobaculum sp.]MDY3617709.1 NAD(P)-binding protein [Agathobaculum sp.]